MALKSMRNFTGSNFSSLRSGVAMSRLRLSRMSRAAAFWTLCRQMMVLSGKPAYRELQYSRRDITNA